MLKKDIQGFTLLELIIVIIIVGVLASLALPKFFAMIEESRSVEALSNISAIRQAMERCYVMATSSGVDGANCTLHGDGAAIPYDITLNTLDLDSPENSPNAHFKYFAYYGGPAGNRQNLLISAQRNTVDGGNGTSGITFYMCLGYYSRKGSGVYKGLSENLVDAGGAQLPYCGP